MSSNNQSDQTTEKGKEPGVQDQPDDQRIKTVTPDNDNGDPGPPAEEAKDNKDERK